MKNNWQTKKLGEVCDFLGGLWKGKEKPYIKVGVIRNTNFTKDGKLDDADIAYLDVEKKQFEKRKLAFGDIILEKSGGGPKQPVGRVIIFDKREGDFSFSNFTSAIRIKNPKELDFNFLHKFLFFSYISGITDRMQSHSTGIRNLDNKLYKAIEVPLPLLSEQRRIVKILDEVFEGIGKAKENAEKNLKNSRELFESYLQNVFVNQRKNPASAKSFGETKWEEKKLGDILQKTETIDPTKNPEKEFIYIDVSSVNKENLTIENTSLIMGKSAPSRARKLIRTGDVIFATVRPTLRRITIIPAEFNEQVCSTGYFVLRSKKELDNKLVFYFVQTKSFNEKMEKLQRGASYPAVSDSDVRNQIISFPKSLPEQKSIVKKLDALAIETKKLEEIYKQKINDLDELKKSVLKKAFNGEL